MKMKKSKDETSPVEETGLAQREKEEPSCYCCGAKHYLRECKVKQSTPQEKQLKPDYQKPPTKDKRTKEKASTHVQVAGEAVKGLSDVQISLAQVETKKPEEIMDSGSTVKLMKSKELLTNLKKSESNY